MKFAIISGSHRKRSQSAKVGRYIESTLEREGICGKTYFLNLADFPLPLWEERIWDGDPHWRQRLAPISRANLFPSYWATVRRGMRMPAPSGSGWK